MVDDGYLVGYEDGSGNFIEVGRFNNTSENVSDPLIIQHSDSGQSIELGPDGFSTESVSTKNLENNIGNGNIQTAWDGLVVPVGDGISMEDAINPANTDTPLTDAIDVINNNGGKGKILVPSGVITESSGNITGMGDIILEGQGMKNSRIDFTNLSEPAIVANSLDDGRRLAIRDIELNGGGSSTRDKGASAIEINQNVSNLNMYNVTFTGWNDEVVHFNESAAFSSKWDNVRFFSGSNSGQALKIDTGGPILHITNLYTGSDDETRDINVGIGTSTRLRIDSWNIGGNTGTALTWSAGGVNSALQIGQINYETGQSPNAVVLLNTARHAEVGNITVAGSADPSYGVSLESNNGKSVIGPMRKDDFGTNVVEIADSQAEPSWYFGPSTDIDNNAGTADGLVRSLADAGTGNG